MSFSAKAQYIVSSIVNLANKHDMTISGLQITGGTSVCITLTNCQRMKIINCKLINSTNRGVVINGCTDIQVLNNYIGEVSDGVYAKDSKLIKVNFNQIYKIADPVKNTNSAHAGRGVSIQFSNVSGPGNQINYNKIDIPMAATGINPNPNTGDDINLYQSNGVSTSPIEVIGNWVRGGGTGVIDVPPFASKWAGIVLGDVGGSYQKATHNIIVNTGYVGIQTQGGDNITINGNMIYGGKYHWSALGLGSSNFSGVNNKNNTIGSNLINWYGGYSAYQRQSDTAWRPKSGSITNQRPRNWDTNHPLAAIDSTILPAHFITGH